jgi:hypothetical protein
MASDTSKIYLGLHINKLLSVETYVRYVVGH